MRLFMLTIMLLLSAILLSDVSGDELESYLMLRPQIKIGKMENGNGFLELQYLKFEYQGNEKLTLTGALSTGFTSQRNTVSDFNPNINSLGSKATYQINDTLGLFKS